MEIINTITVNKIYNNRLEETLEIEINNKYKGTAPSGASKGKHEAPYGKVDEVIKELNKIKDKYIGEKVDFYKIDRELKFLKERIKANGAVAFSFALYNAYIAQKIDNKKAYYFPYPLSNILGGGAHNGYTTIQEFLVIPKKVKSFEEAVKLNKEAYLELKEKLKKQKKFCGFNDEAATIAKIDDEKALDMIAEIAQQKGLRVGVDVASSTFYNTKTKKYVWGKEKLSKEEHLEKIKSLIEQYDLWYIEDPFQEEDFESFAELRKYFPKRIITGDDLTTTNPERLKIAINNKSIKGIIIKPNQIGTLSESFEVKKTAEKHKILPIISHRSGEAEDPTISRVAVFENFPVIKAGIGGIRVVKINELLRLWEKLDHTKMNSLW